MEIKIKNHDFLPGDEVYLTNKYSPDELTIGKLYKIIEVGFFNVLVVNDANIPQWINASYFRHKIKVTAVKKHLKRLVLGR